MSDRGTFRRSRRPSSSKRAPGPHPFGTGRDAGTQGPTLALVGRRRPRLRLLPAELRPLDEEGQRAAASALCSLYRAFLETGGLDSFAERRSHAASQTEEGRAA